MHFFVVTKMQRFLVFTCLMLTLRFCFASEQNNTSDYNEYEYDDPTNQLELDDEDTDVHLSATKGESRQIIFNPRKRRERRKQRKGKHVFVCWFVLMVFITINLFHNFHLYSHTILFLNLCFQLIFRRTKKKHI